MSGLSFDAIVQGLVDAGVPRPAAEAQARRECGLPAAGTATMDAEERERALEKEIVRQADRQMRALGFVVVELSQPRRAKYLSPGVPDRRYYHPARGLALWWEAKTPTGRQSPAQRQFQEWCDAAGDAYVLGTDEALHAWLIERGVAFEEGGLLVPLPYTPAQRSA